MDYMDLLSRLGIASAHPGGFKATKKRLEKALQPGDLRILEVGCGTGKTACYVAKLGFRVTALDQHPLMLQKARIRAVEEGIDDISWVGGKVEALPFENESFDVVLAESVTIFTDLSNTLKEYYRVLKPGGKLLDREMVLFQEMPDPIYKEIRDYFGIDKIHTVDKWLQSLRQVGFHCDSPSIEPFCSHEQSVEPNEMRELDLTMLIDPEIAQGILRYSELMLAQERYFRACDFEAYKK